MSLVRGTASGTVLFTSVVDVDDDTVETVVVVVPVVVITVDFVPSCDIAVVVVVVDVIVVVSGEDVVEVSILMCIVPLSFLPSCLSLPSKYSSISQLKKTDLSTMFCIGLHDE